MGSFRAFARLPVNWTPKKSVLQKTISAIDADTWERINRCLSLEAKTAKVESAQTFVRENEQVRERQRAEVLRLLDEISGLRNQLAKIEEFLAGNERQAARLREEETKPAD